ncbi:MAG: methionyl-tRNA formyltransferase [Candidatus Riflebacteria bacterium HGW-Riflebacteria-1]|jgi:methionyl-tRNA formyltransferase|nr:MAG: methionyl-tRNA formyltransferase [Candidatus Riflebacteria bacterium HGW-Riflebacteria-1]
MSKAPLRLVFMGCPQFAVPCLERLHQDSDFSVVAVYCMPDRPKGRGKKPSPTPVKLFANDHGLPVFSPATFRQAPEEVERLRGFAPDFLVVVAYGLILPQSVLDIPAIAPVNLHASILPEYRGPSPIHHALLDGRKVTGNTVMLMSKGMDEGDILAIETTPVEAHEDFASVHDRLSAMGAELLVKTLKEYAAGRINRLPQQHTAATYTAKITPQTARINWHNPANIIINQIRAMSPSPGAWFEDAGERIKVFRAVPAEAVSASPGTVIEQQPGTGIKIACGEGTSLILLELQRAGKSRLSCREFLCGCGLKSSRLDSDNQKDADNPACAQTGGVTK